MLDGKTGGDGGAPSSTEPLSGPQLAQAGAGDAQAEPIGVIRAISGQVGLIQISSTPGEIGVASPVHLNDTVTTGPGGAIEILFVDGTSFSLGADARVQIDKLIYNPDGGGNGLDISVATGAFAFIAGSIAEAPGEGMSIEMPAGTIGIRGTAGAGTPDPASGGYLVSVFQGHITVSTLAGVVLLDEPLETTRLSSRFAPPSEPRPLTPDAAEDLFGGALQLLRGRQQDLHEQPEEEFAQFGNINPAAGEASDAPVEAAEPLPVQLQLADVYGLLRLLAELGALPPGALENTALNFPEFFNDALGTKDFQPLAFANTPPMATDDTPDPNDGGPLAGLSTGEDTSLTIPADRLLANDSDPDGDTLTITSVSDPPHGTAVLNSDGSITYTPDANYNGTDSFTYTVSDGQGGSSTATVTVEIAAVNDPPVAGNDSPDPGGAPGSGLTTSEDSSLTIAAATLLANDSDADGDGLTITAVGDPAHGTAVLNADGSITYTPDANYNGADSFTYTVSDGQGGTATATATVNVQSVNDLPVAGNDSASTDEDTPVTIPVLGNDSDADGDALTVTEANAENGTVQVNPDGTLTYTPAENFNGTDTITYTVSDGNGGTATATATVKVAPVNDDPVAVNDGAETSEDTPVVIDVLDNDTDADGDDLTVTKATAEHGAVTFNDDGTLTYAPNANFNGTDTITYTVSDGNGGTDTGTATVTVASVNDPPVAGDDKATTREDTALTIAAGTLLANDSDVDKDQLTITGVSDPEHGTAVVNKDGSVTYTPDPDYKGPDSFTYTVSDGKGGTDTATVAVTVEDSTPKPGHETATVSEAGLAAGSRPADNTETATGTLTLGDPDSPVISEITFAGKSYTDAADGNTDGVITVASTAGLLEVNTASGEYTYTLTNPTQGDAAQESFTYTVADKFGNSANGSLTVGIVDDAPTATSDTVSTADTVDQTVNLVIILDISISMNQDPGVDGFATRLELAKAALADLFAAYEATTDINVLIVPFSGSATSSGWLTSGQTANDYLDGRTAGGGTNYAAAIEQTMAVYGTGLPAADKTQVYFLSDGAPTQNQSLRDRGLVDDWERFVADSKIEDVFAVGIGRGISADDPDLADVALPNGPADNPEPNLIVVRDESRLTETLVDTVPSTVSGNILANDVFGADGRGNGGVGLLSITIDGVTYSYDKATDQITSGGKIVDDDAVLTTKTNLGGTLELDFTNGAFKYVAPDLDDTASASEKFAYAIVDGDGDVSTSTLTVNITDAGGGSSLQSLAVTTDRGAERTGRSEALSAESSGEAEAGPHRLHGGGALRRPALDARDIFADRELDQSTLGHRGADSQGHVPPGHDLHALGERHTLDAAPPPAATVGPADVDFHHTGG